MPVLRPGATLKRGTFHIVTLLGHGGFGEVYLAQQPRMDREVAIKVLSASVADDPEVLRRFEREARAAGSFLHPNILPVLDFDFDEDVGLWFLAMQYVRGGRTLKDRLATPMPLLDTHRIVKGIAEALAIAHERGIVHRDVKPGNVLLDEYDRPLLTDFGIAHLASMPGITGAGVTIGTLAYMAPEQASGEQVGPAADQYALGVIVYEMIVGRPPFAGRSYAVLLQHFSAPPPPLLGFSPTITESIERVVFRALNKSPTDRYRSCRDFSDALGNAIQESLITTLGAKYEQVTRLIQDGDLDGALALLEAVQQERPDSRDVDALVAHVQREITDRTRTTPALALPRAEVVPEAERVGDGSLDPAGGAAGLLTYEALARTDEEPEAEQVRSGAADRSSSGRRAGLPAGSRRKEEGAHPPLAPESLRALAAPVGLTLAGVLLIGVAAILVPRPGASTDLPRDAPSGPHLPAIARGGQASTPVPTTTLTADERWGETDREVELLWAEDWAGAVALLDELLADAPDNPAATEKLYAALIAHGHELLEEGLVSEAVQQFLRARSLLPDQSEAVELLLSLTPTATAVPTPPPAFVPTAVAAASPTSAPTEVSPAPTATLRPPIGPQPTATLRAPGVEP